MTKQTLEWKTGDRYRTEDGTVMEIVEIETDVYCTDEDRNEHSFTSDGDSLCCCEHGNLVSRITGTMQDDVA